METSDQILVLDTSVAAAWFFLDETLRDHSLRVRDLVLSDPHMFVVPTLFHSELIHVLARKSGRDRRMVAQSLQLIIRLGLRTLSLTDSALQSAGRWACKGLSGYDATFVALAEELDGRWLTADVTAARIAGPRRALQLQAWPGLA